MKAELTQYDVELKITLTNEKLMLLHEGIGSTSVNLLMKSGMTEAQGKVLSEFWSCVNEAIRKTK